MNEQIEFLKTLTVDNLHKIILEFAKILIEGQAIDFHKDFGYFWEESGIFILDNEDTVEIQKP